MNPTKTIDINDVRKECMDIGDKLKDNFNLTKDVKVAMIAVSAYSAAINSAKTQLIYKKLTGAPTDIEFLNDKVIKLPNKSNPKSKKIKAPGLLALNKSSKN